MNEKDLKRLVQVEAKSSTRSGWRCPDEMRIAAYVEHRVSAADEARIESHIAACAACLEQVAFLARHAADGDAAVDAHLVSRARDLVPSKPSAWPGPVVRWASVAAAAACLVLVIALQLRQPGAPSLPGAPQSAPAPIAPPGGAGVAPAGTPDAPAAASGQAPPALRATVRKSASAPLALHMLIPAENAVLAVQEPEFRWQAIPGASYYEIEILTEEGNVAWQGKVEGTSTQLPSGHPLKTDTKYFVWVRAHLTGGGTIKSAAVSFHVGS